MKRVLVAQSLQEFAAQAIGQVRIELFDGPVPAGDFQGIVPTVADRVGKAEIDRLADLQVIANYGVGYDNIDVTYARERGVGVANTPGVLTDATAELTWALILSVTRRLGEGERMVRAGQWSGWAPTQLRGTGLNGKLLGIIGAGRIGSAVAARAAAFGMQVGYWSRHRHETFERTYNARWFELDELIRHADVASIHLSRSAATDSLIDARRLALLRDGAVLINTARGTIIDEPALVRELASGRIRAGLDVYAAEPAVPAELFALENVVLLPHLGSATYEARLGMWQLAWSNLLAGIAGEPLLNPVP